MGNYRSRLARTPRWLLVTLLAVAIGLGVSAGTSRRGGPPADPWTALVQAGDDLAVGRPTALPGGRPLTTQAAYLLAFHEAQDAGDLEHVLAAADRLDAAGQADLAAHVHRAAEALMEDLGR